MYLKRLEILGFKTFAERTELHFAPGVTAVVGPNGSGKSNIADAILWVLGENNVRSLRGSSAQDVIFAGNERRRPLSMAEVAARLSAATGKTIRYVNVPPEDARKAQLAAGMPPFLADALFELFSERRKGIEARVWPDSERLLGRRPTSFDEFARRNAAAFRGEASLQRA